MTMLRHTAGLRQIYDEMRFTRNRTRQLQEIYDKVTTKCTTAH